jgi:hypothetical protein
VSRGALLFTVATIAAIALVGAYVALGGTEFRPSRVADPCLPRGQAPASGSTSAAVQRAVLAAADEVACSLGTSREELVLALRSADDLEALARRRGVDRDGLEASVRAGLVRAADQAGADGLLGERTAAVVRAAARHLPLELLLTLLRGIDTIVGT